jgi:hypothetical protein
MSPSPSRCHPGSGQCISVVIENTYRQFEVKRLEVARRGDVQSDSDDFAAEVTSVVDGPNPDGDTAVDVLKADITRLVNLGFLWLGQNLTSINYGWSAKRSKSINQHTI